MNAGQRLSIQRENGDTFKQFEARFDVALIIGLGAAAEVYRNALAAKLQQGYTTGKYASGEAAESLKIRRIRMGDHGPETSVYTTDFKQRMWEFGAFNAFTRKYERVEHWRLTLEEQGRAMAQAFHGAFTQQIAA